VRDYTSCSYRYGGHNDVYHREIIKTEKKLTRIVGKIMLERKLYFDVSNRELVNVVKREKKGDGWVSMHLENGMRVDVKTE